MGFRRMRALTVFAMALALGAVGAAADEASQAPPCVGVTLSATPASGHGETDKGFSARRILDLGFHVELARGAPPDGLTLKIFTPNGHLYQQIDVPVAPAGSREATRALPGYPFPVKVAAVRAVRAADDGIERAVVDAPPFLVAGTNIVSSSLYGRWRVEAWVKDAPEACSAQFNIFP